MYFSVTSSRRHFCFGVLCLPPGITVLLSLTVFMLMVAEIMPATSDSVPLIGQFLSVCACAGVGGGFISYSLSSIVMMNKSCYLSMCHRSILCQHHGDRRDVSRGHGHRPSVSSPQSQQRTDATLGEFVSPPSSFLYLQLSLPELCHLQTTGSFRFERNANICSKLEMRYNLY